MLGVSCFILTLQLCLFTTCLAENPSGTMPTNCTCGLTNKVTEKIINGTEVTPHKYPWMVQIRLFSGQFRCGGSIITVRHILSAAHCTHGIAANRIFVVTGAEYVEPEEYGVSRSYDVESRVEHEDYDHSIVRHDIALLITVKPIEMMKAVGPVCLPSLPLKMTYQKVRVTGWGKTNYPGPLSQKLQEAIFDVVDTEICDDHFPNIMNPTPTQLCLRNPEKSTCDGDTGTAGTWMDPETGLHIQVGIVSFGWANCSTDHPEVQTDVNYYLPWIQRNVASFGGDVATCAKIICT